MTDITTAKKTAMDAHMRREVDGRVVVTRARKRDRIYVIYAGHKDAASTLRSLIVKARMLRN